jgi:hypothetical protein
LNTASRPEGETEGQGSAHKAFSRTNLGYEKPESQINEPLAIDVFKVSPTSL